MPTLSHDATCSYAPKLQILLAEESAPGTLETTAGGLNGASDHPTPPLLVLFSAEPSCPRSNSQSTRQAECVNQKH